MCRSIGLMARDPESVASSEERVSLYVPEAPGSMLFESPRIKSVWVCNLLAVVVDAFHPVSPSRGIVAMVAGNGTAT